MDTSEAPALVRHVTPTIERARELGVALPEAAPREVLHLAVLRVACRAQFRRSWPDHPEMPDVDSQGDLTDVYLPTALRQATGLLHVERVIESIVPLVPPDEFECKDLRPVTEESAYRGARRQQDPKFFGFDYQDAIEVAKRGTDDFLRGKGKILSWKIRAWAWPVLWLRWPGAADPYGSKALDVVLVARPEGTIERIGSDDPPAP